MTRRPSGPAQGDTVPVGAMPVGAMPSTASVGGPPLSRRAAIAAGAGAAGLGLLAGCGSDAPAASAGGAAVTPGGSSGGTGSPIVALSSITVGGAVAARIGGRPAVVARPTDTTAAAFSAICTHMGCTVNVDGAVLVCPCHGSRYDALTGAVTRGPAVRNLEAIAVHVVDGEVMTT
jgi:nitrite reductase/ring-hydroxylating ferredoxin subunit